MSPELPITSTSKLLSPDGGDGLKSKPTIPDHELFRCIGQGAYGEVWLARNVLGAYRAIKIVYRKSFQDEHTYEREFRGIQQFEPVSRANDGLLDILQAGRNDDAGYYYYVMELADDAAAPVIVEVTRLTAKSEFERSPVTSAATVETYTPKTLTTAIQQRGRLPPAECVQLGLNLTLALGHLHRHGLIHRDIKPANIIFVQDIPKLADIGLVTSFNETCSFVGTEGFIAPEGPTSPRADLFSLGKVLYELSTGKDRKDFPEPPTGLGESSDGQELAELNAVILKACAVVPRDRYQTAEEFHADLALLNSGKSVRWKRVVERRLAFARKAGAVVGVIAVLAMGGFLFQRHQTREAIRLKQVAEDLATRLQIQNAENLFARGDSSLALAHLGQVLRRQPGNRVAAERIMAAVTQRNFPRLVTQPLLHEARLITAHFSPDGQRLVSASESNTVRLWNTQTGEEAIPPLRHARQVNAVEFSPDGSKIATASGDRTVRIWETRTGASVLPPLQHDRGVRAVTFEPAGQFLATAAGTNARIYRLQSGELLWPPMAHEDTVYSVAFSPDGRWLATGSEDECVRVWEVDSGKLKYRFKQDGPVSLVRFSRDGQWLAAAIHSTVPMPEDKSWHVQMWNLESGQPLAQPLFHDHVYSLAFSPDSQRLVTGDGDNMARVWQVSSGAELFRLSHSAMVYSAEFSPDGQQILTASVDRTAQLWDAATGAALSESMRHDGRVIHAEFSREGGQALTAGWEDKTVKLWNLRAVGSSSRTLPHDAWVKFAEFDATGKEVITATADTAYTANKNDRWTGRERHTVSVWDSATGVRKFAPPIPRGAQAVTAQFTQNGPQALLATEAGSRHGRIWARGGATIHHDGAIVSAHFSTAGGKLATGSEDGTARVWDVSQGNPLTRPLVHTGTVNSVRFSQDSRRLVTGSDDRTAMIWDAITGERVAGPLMHKAGVWLAQFSPTGDKVVTASLDYFARVWSTNGLLLATFQHRAPVEYAEFNPDGTKVVTASADGTARLWSVSTSKQLTGPLEHKEAVLTARFSPDGRHVITASMDRTAQVWDVMTGQKMTDPFRHQNWVVSARFSPDGSRAITASTDQTAKLWEVPQASPPIPSWLPDLAEAVAGQRLDVEGEAQPVAWSEYVQLKARLTKLPATNAYVQWVGRFLDEPGSRPTVSTPNRDVSSNAEEEKKRPLGRHPTLNRSANPASPTPAHYH